jgi:SAM-dependent methyltransferase
VKGAVAELGWTHGEKPSFTPNGFLVADSIREYVFWVQRDRKLHCEGQVDCLSADYYAGKSVLEIGSGFGCNLIPISKVARRVVGIEPIGIYREMSKIICEREHIPPLDIRPGAGEAIPIHDEDFDVVLCVSAHQYMDVRAAIREMARVLAPGGELQIVGGTIDTFGKGVGKALFGRPPREVISYVLTILNTVSYMASGRRVYQRSKNPSTGFPVYPTRGSMARWLTGEKLTQKRAYAQVGPETVFCFERQPGS